MGLGRGGGFEVEPRGIEWRVRHEESDGFFKVRNQAIFRTASKKSDAIREIIRFDVACGIIQVLLINVRGVEGPVGALRGSEERIDAA